MRIAISRSAALSFLLLMAPQALAQDTGPDYVLSVPVRIENTRLSNAYVRCDLLPVGPSSRLAPVPLVDGAYRGTIRVEVTLPAGIVRESLARFSCGLFLQRARTPSGAHADVPFPHAEGYTTVTGQRVASSVLRVSGPLPR